MNRYLLTILIVAVLSVPAIVFLGPTEAATDAAQSDRTPHIDPDYAGATIPPNIAPLSFAVLEPGEQYHVLIEGDKGRAIDIRNYTGDFRPPQEQWRALLKANAGRTLRVTVSVRLNEQAWRTYPGMSIHVSLDPIDPYVVYRRTRPIFNEWKDMAIIQRHIEAFDEKVLVDNSALDHGCINCHTFSANRPNSMLFHVRSDTHGVAMVLAEERGVAKVDTRTAFNKSPVSYSSWSPDGKLVAGSVNKLTQFFHTVGENRDVFDFKSDLIVYRIDENEVTTSTAIGDPARNETFPSWAPDGRYLYFSSAPPVPVERFEEVRYDLVRVRYDPVTDTWGERETLLAGDAIGKTLLEARVSPDNRFVLFSAAAFGNFPVYKPSCDLYLMDLETRDFWPLECNSDQADSYHAWSSNGRWIVFSSKRRDGVFARPHFAHIDENGRAAKAFVLPQEDPRYYLTSMRTFTAPEFTTGAVRFPDEALARAVVEPSINLKAELDPAVELPETPDTEPTSPWRQSTIAQQAR